MNYQPPPPSGYPPPPSIQMPPGNSGERDPNAPPQLLRSTSSAYVQIGEPSPREIFGPSAQQHQQQYHQQFTCYAPPPVSGGGHATASAAVQSAPISMPNPMLFPTPPAADLTSIYRPPPGPPPPQLN